VITSVALVLAVLVLPTILILGTLFLVASAVAALADGAVPGGVFRRPAS
jgi:hypothetical protein